jgi:membrane protein implicated in regulation of membrane protease activity
MEALEIIVICFIVGLVLYRLVYEPFINYWQNSPPFHEQVFYFFSKIEIQIILAIMILVPVAFFIRRYRIKKAEEKRRSEERERSLKEDKNKLKEIIKEDYGSMGSSSLKWHIRHLEEQSRYFGGSSYFTSKIEKTIKMLEGLLEKRILMEEEYRKREYEKEYEREISLQKKRIQKSNLWKKLKADDTILFEVNLLKNEEYKILAERGFERINEYDPVRKENVDFLVRRILNHSLRHTVLVERIKTLLESYPEVQKVLTHDTRDADISFLVNYQSYAIEIETGTLLAKKNQITNKVAQLNNKYGFKKWFFVVSHRDLVPKYRKFGLVSTRTGVREMIEKVAKIAHPS